MIGMTFAYELCHIFTCSLLYEVGTAASADSNPSSAGTRTVVESGRFWETTVFGGEVDIRQGRNTERLAVKDEFGIRTSIIHGQTCTALIERSTCATLPKLFLVQGVGD